MPPTISEATPADVEPAVKTLTEAFLDYPYTRHTIAADGHLDRLARVERLFVTEIGLAHGRVWVADNADAVAVWTTPASTRIAEAFARLRPELTDIAGDRAQVSAASEAVLAPHRPATAVWFLCTVGVRPDRQGHGLGRAILEPGLAAADDEHSPVFLETSVKGNVAFYRKLGFEVTAEVVLPHNGPRTWAMLRAPR